MNLFFVKKADSIYLCKKKQSNKVCPIALNSFGLIIGYFSIESNSTSKTNVLSGSIPLAPLEP